MLRFENVCVEMDHGTRLIADLALQPGHRIAILGPSGAGKSTLLDLVAGFRTPSRGRLLWHGEDLTPLPPEARPVSILFQDGNLFPHLTVERNLGLALMPDGRRPGATARRQIENALGRVGLEGFGPRRPATLSGGQLGRAALARVLLMARPIILLDEPFAALGPGLKQEMLAVVREVADSLSALVLLVTHEPRDAAGFADEVVLVADARVHPSVETETFLANPPQAFREYMGL